MTKSKFLLLSIIVQFVESTSSLLINRIEKVGLSSNCKEMTMARQLYRLYLSSLLTTKFNERNQEACAVFFRSDCQ